LLADVTGLWPGGCFPNIEPAFLSLSLFFFACYCCVTRKSFCKLNIIKRFLRSS
jgi:hypothetical protein